MKKVLSSLFLLCFIVSTIFAQEKTVSGTVKGSEDDAGLPGVSVRVKGSTTGTQTGMDGRYSITVPGNQAVLVFTYIGYTTREVHVGGNRTVNITLDSDAKQLGEVIVTGYSTSSKTAFTGSAKVVTAENLERKNVSNVSQALAGEVAGLRVVNTSGQPGTAATIRVRGFGSVNGNRDPLIVVDGVPFTGGLNSINPSDIESTTVLKDATATAIYGARGSNGVIVITTKSGRGSKSFIEADGNFGTNMSIIPRYDVIRSPELFASLGWEALYNQGRAVGNANPEAYANTRLFAASGFGGQGANIWNNVTTGADLIDPATRSVRAGVTRKFDPENWGDYAFQNSARTETNVKFGGSSDKTSFFSSVGYLNDKGYLLKSQYERFSGRINVNHEVKPWLTTAATMNYARSETNNPGQQSDSGGMFWFIDNMPSIYSVFQRDANGNKIPDPIFGGYLYSYGRENQRRFANSTNAIGDATYDTRRTKRNEFNGSGNLNIKFFDGLTLENRIGAQYYNNVYLSVGNKFYGSSVTQGGSIYQETSEMFSYNLLNLLRYDKRFNDHHISALAAHEVTDWERKFQTASKSKFVDDLIFDFNNAIITSPNTGYTENYKMESYFAQANYDFKGKYFLSGTVRRDGSSRFRQDRWGTFGSVGASWIVSEEEFMKQQNIFSFLKLKASYGLIGDQAGVGYYPGYTSWAVSNVLGEIGYEFKTVGTPELTWEKTKMFQVGTEFGIGKVLSGSIDYYVKNTDDLIFERRVGPSIGYALLRVNGGMLRNSGLEFDLAAKIINSRDWRFGASVNGEILQNKITKMPLDPTIGRDKLIDVQGNYGWAKGRSIYDFFLREWAGVDPADGRATWTRWYNDANGNGSLDAGESIANMVDYLDKNPGVSKSSLSTTTTKTYTDATLDYVGKSAIPSVRGAFNLNGGFKGLELNVQFLYSLGGYGYDGAYASLMHNGAIGSNNWHTDILNRWQQPGDVKDVPRLSNNADPNVSSASTRFLTKLNYLTLNNVRLSYAIPSSFLSQYGIGGLSIWVSGDNLWMTSKRDGFNPSTSESGASDTYRYAPLSTVSAGLRVRL